MFPPVIKNLTYVREARDRITREFEEDPYLGYPSISDALQDYKCTPQVEVLARLLNRENVFISGPAGSGKTTLIKRFMDIVDAQFEGMFNLAVTASTGVAATNLPGGVTIHSWAGLGIDTLPFDAHNITSHMNAKRHNMIYADVLIIDEISMLPAYLFTKLDFAMRHFRDVDEPFGGVQVVVMGDFLQLPPVDKREVGVDASFVATTETWHDLGLSYCYMDKVHRAQDHRLEQILVDISRGKVTESSKALIKSREGQSRRPSVTYTNLFTTNSNVDVYNQKCLDSNPNPPITLTARSGGTDSKAVETLKKSGGIPEKIVIKKGATVMLTSNTPGPSPDKFYPNGSIGKVIVANGEYVQIQFNDGRILQVGFKRTAKTEKVECIDPASKRKTFYPKEVAWIEQVPIKLGYAITVHKSQGQTLDGVIVDLTKCFTPGLGYVALSRVRSLDDLIIKGISPNAYDVDPLSLKLSTSIKKRALDGRRQFEAKVEQYNTILTNDLMRIALWDISVSGEARRQAAKAQGK